MPDPFAPRDHPALRRYSSHHHCFVASHLSSRRYTLPSFAGVKITFIRTPDHAALAGTRLANDNPTLLVAGRTRRQTFVAALELARSVDRIALALPVNLASRSFRCSKLSRE